MPTRAYLFLATVILLAPFGCGPAKLDQKFNYEIVPGDSKLVHLTKQPKPQRITVEYESDQPVEVGIYNTADVKDDLAPPASKARAIDRAKATGSISADLGPDEATTVVVSALGKKANVKVQIHNKK